jgi:hypothetical protein
LDSQFFLAFPGFTLFSFPVFCLTHAIVQGTNAVYESWRPQMRASPAAGEGAGLHTHHAVDLEPLEKHDPLEPQNTMVGGFNLPV